MKSLSPNGTLIKVKKKLMIRSLLSQLNLIQIQKISTRNHSTSKSSPNFFCAAVGFAEGIESSNIVGYAGKASGAQNNFLTIPFNGVGYNTADIQSIKISGDGIGWGTEIFSVWEGVPTVAEGSGFAYWDPAMDPSGEATECYWGDIETCDKATYSIAPGQAVVIDCSADLDITTIGEVPTAAVQFTSIEQNNFTGNPFPAEIDIQNIKISGDGIGWGTEIFSIWEGVPTVREGSGFAYWDPAMDPNGEATECFWGDIETCEKATYSISVGQGVVIDCAAGLTISIAAPYTL